MNEERLAEIEQNINNVLTRTAALDVINKKMQGHTKALSMLEEKMSVLEADVDKTKYNVAVALHKIDDLKKKADDVIDLIKPKKWGQRYGNRFNDIEERISKLEEPKQFKKVV